MLDFLYRVVARPLLALLLYLLAQVLGWSLAAFFGSVLLLPCWLFLPREALTVCIVPCYFLGLLWAVFVLTDGPDTGHAKTRVGGSSMSPRKRGV